MINKNKFRIILYLPLFLLLTSGTASANNQLKAYFPMQAGAAWVYVVKTTKKPIMKLGTITRKVVNTKKGNFIVKQNADVMGAALQTKWTYGFTKAGLIEHGFLRHNIPTEKLLLKLPLRKGNTWHYKGLTFVIKSISERVKTPSGNYANCIHVLEYSKKSLLQEYWYKKGIGWVRIISHPGGELLLKSYSKPSPAPPDIRIKPNISPNALNFKPNYALTPFAATANSINFSPSSQAVSLPVILMNFSDTTPLTTTTVQYFEQMLFSTVLPAPLYPYSSLALYYKDMSHGGLAVTGSVYGWFTATNSHDYYGDGCYGLCNDGADKLAREAITDACNAGVPFSTFGDQNGTRYAVIIHQGHGAEQTASFTSTDIWSYEATLNPTVTCNGTQINGYIIVPEQTILPYFDQVSDSNSLTKKTGPIDMGVIAHEIGHTLGLIDLYDPNWKTTGAYGIGIFGLMSYGGDGPYPTELSPWSRQLLGWFTPTTIGSNACDISLKPIETGGGIIKLHTPGMGPLEYLLISDSMNESFDRLLPGNGLLIWHIDDAISDESYPWYPGHTASHYKVALIQADGTYDLEKGINVGDPQDYYRTGNTLSPTSNPSSISYTGYNTNIIINNIRFKQNGSGVFNIILNPSAAQPYIVNSLPTTINALAGSAFSFTLQASGAQPMSYTVITGPANLTIDKNGVIHWKPTISDKGENPVDIDISNCYGSARASLTINVLTSSLNNKGICVLSTIFGSNNPILTPLRGIRAKLMETHIGRKLVHAYYYDISPYLIKKAADSVIYNDLIRYILAPLIILLGLLLTNIIPVLFLLTLLLIIRIKKTGIKKPAVAKRATTNTG